MSEPPRLRNVLHPVTDVSAAIAYYANALELSTNFIDGDRYAALEVGGVTLALVGQDEDVTGGVVAASLKVASLTEALHAIRQHGGSILSPAHDGPHETRAVVQDPWGNVMVIYETKNFRPDFAMRRCSATGHIEARSGTGLKAGAMRLSISVTSPESAGVSCREQLG